MEDLHTTNSAFEVKL